MAERDRKRRRAHLDQHIRDANGEYHYVGDWYVLQGGQRALAPFALWTLLAAAGVIAAGCVNFPGMMNTWYVILPYVLSAGLVFALLWQGGKLLSGRGRLKAYDYEGVQEKLSPIAGGLIFAAALTGLLGGVYLLRHGADDALGCIAFYASLAVAALGARMAGKAWKQQVWEKAE